MSITRFGRDTAQATPTPQDNWLPTYGGEVIAAFAISSVMSGLVNHKTITEGQDAEFPAFWKIGSEYHQAGVKLLGMNQATRKYVISVDDRGIVSHYRYDDIDRLMSHYDNRSQASFAMGQALAKRDEENILRLLVNTSRFPQGNSTEFPGGGSDGNGDAIHDTALANEDVAGATAVLNAIDTTIVRWDELDVPATERYCVVKPGMFNQLRNIAAIPGHSILTSNIPPAGLIPLMGHADADSVNPQFAAGMGPMEALEYKGVKIFKSNYVPTTDQSNIGLPTKYAGDFSNTKGVIFQKTAIGHLTLLAPTVEMDRETDTQTDLMVVKMLTGGGALRPYCAVELDSAAS